MVTKKTKVPSNKKAPSRVSGRYIEGVGRRKTSSARVRIYPASKEKVFLVEGKPLEEYFKLPELEQYARDPLNKLDLGIFKVTVKVRGGGIAGQAGAIRHGLARALMAYNPELRPQLKSLGYLSRDPRMKERKKPGLKKARRAAQWQKR
jgi:small subunit ribosomal protein S9